MTLIVKLTKILPKRWHINDHDDGIFDVFDGTSSADYIAFVQPDISSVMMHNKQAQPSIQFFRVDDEVDLLRRLQNHSYMIHGARSL